MQAISEPDPAQAATASPFALPPDFLARHWRQRPLHLPGAAAAFLPDAPSRGEISALIDAGAPCQTDGSTVWFLEGLTSGLPGVADLVTRARDWLEWRDVWCDVFLTVGRSSIGSHYDGSDNFTLQLAGSKTWFLSGPGSVHPDDHRRVLGEPGLGAASMPGAPMVFEVRAGDALYIPSNWIHWGFSDGDSSSVSLVINVATPLHAMQEQVIQGLRRDPAWSRPLPVGPGSTAERVELLRGLLTEDLPHRLRKVPLGRVADRDGSTASIKGRIDVSAAAPSADLSWAEAYLERVSLCADDPQLDDRGLRELLRLRAQRNLRRLLSLCTERFGGTDSQGAGRIYVAVSAGLRMLPYDTLDSLLTDPEVCCWLTLAARDAAMSAGRSRVEDPLADALGLFVLPDVMPYLPAGEPLVLDLAADDDGSLTVRRSGCRLLFPDQPRRIGLRLAGHGFQLIGPDAAEATRPPAALLPVTSTGVVITTQWSDWLARVAPGSAPGLAVPSPGEWAERVAATMAAVGEGGLPTHLVPWVLVRERVPVNGIGEYPLPSLPGLPVLDTSRPARWAQSVASVLGHTEFDLIAEAFPLFADGLPAGGRRKTAEQALRRRHVRARLRQAHLSPDVPDADPGDDALERSTAWLTPWGRAILEKAAGD